MCVCVGGTHASERVLCIFIIVVVVVCVQDHKIRETYVKEAEKRFGPRNFQFSIGGQISVDVFPKGWDKTYCLKFVADQNFDEIHFFGDKTYKVKTKKKKKS